MISILIDKVNQVFDALEEANENQIKEIQNRFHYFSGWSYWCNHDNCDEIK